MRLLVILTVFLATLTAAQAQSVTFAGERYSSKFRGCVMDCVKNGFHPYLKPGGDGESLEGWSYVALGPDGDSPNAWKKLITFHAFPGMRDVKTAAISLARTASQRTLTRMNLIASDARQEATVEFSWREGDVTEFNVFKYAPASHGGGVVAVQFSQRFRGSIEPEDVMEMSRRTIGMAHFDMNLARAFLGQ